MADKNPVIDKLFSVGAHFGYSPSRRHPSTSAYIFGAKGGVELFDLEQVAKLLSDSLEFVAKLAGERKTILFVGGKAEAREAVVRAAERLNQPYCAGRWIGGSLTNFQEIKRRLNRLDELTDMREKGELAKFTKKERLLIDREIVDLELMFGGLKGMTKNPDALFVVDPKQEAIAVAEARQLNIPVIALMNSDCDRQLVTHPIPANDAAREVIQYVLGEVADTYEKSLAPIAPAAPIAAAAPANPSV
ncbi:MAG: 30S ribosomal protein S2 [Candidatus Pacebacteria bacterium]|nr:30S ribosomal protein S2 [Candidatus Paceibacterota bacterium]